jgi:hypothetical protein
LNGLFFEWSILPWKPVFSVPAQSWGDSACKFLTTESYFVITVMVRRKWYSK